MEISIWFLNLQWSICWYYKEKSFIFWNNVLTSASIICKHIRNLLTCLEWMTVCPYSYMWTYREGATWKSNAYNEIYSSHILRRLLENYIFKPFKFMISRFCHTYIYMMSLASFEAERREDSFIVSCL